MVTEALQALGDAVDPNGQYCATVYCDNLAEWPASDYCADCRQEQLRHRKNPSPPTVCITLDCGQPALHPHSDFCADCRGQEVRERLTCEHPEVRIICRHCGEEVS